MVFSEDGATSLISDIRYYLTISTKAAVLSMI